MPSHVIVVGAGFAGLAAASQLRGAGHRVTVIEAEARPGGRTRGGERDGFQWDAGPYAHSARDEGLIGLVRAAGLEGSHLPLRPERLFQVRGQEATRIDPARTAGIAAMPGMRWRDALRLRRLPRLLAKFDELIDPTDPLRATRLDDRSAADFLRLYFGRTSLEVWGAPLLTGDLLADPAETSRLAFVLHHLVRHEAAVGSLRGGLAAVAHALVDEGDQLGARVRAIEAARAGFRVVAESAGETRSLEADAVVLATPAEAVPGLAGTLLTHAERGIFDAAHSLPAIALVAGLEGRFAGTSARYRFLPTEERPVASLSVVPGSAPGEQVAPEGCERAVLLATASWSAEHLSAPDEVVRKTLLGSLGRVLPGAVPALRFSEVVRHPAALPHFAVGRYRALERLARVEADRLAHGRALVFAGDYRIAPTVEGAVQSGLAAARALDAALSRRRRDRRAER